MSTHIRRMERRDAECVLEMMRVFYASPAVLSNGSEEIFRADVEHCVNDSPYLEGYVMEEQGQICGYAMAAKSFSTEFGRPCIWLEDLYVRKEFRGKGIGKGLLRFLSERYPGHLLRLEVEAENEGAIRLYESCGFSVLPYVEMKK